MDSIMKKFVPYFDCVKYLLILGSCYLFSELFLSVPWRLHTGTLHTVSELLCIFIALSSFFIVILTFKSTTISLQIIGFGFLMVAIYDLFHTFYFTSLEVFPPEAYDAGTMYWLLGRLTEALVIISSMLRVFRFKFFKWLAMITAITVPTGISLLVLYFPGILPVMLASSGPTPAKTASEFSIIGLFIFCLYLLKRNKHKRSVVRYKYIYMAVLIAIPSELSLTFYPYVNSTLVVYGHVLKVIYYIYYFRGIFASAVSHPYQALLKSRDRFRESQAEMAEILNSMPIGIAISDESLRVTFINRKGKELLECSSSQLLGLSVDEIARKLRIVNSKTGKSGWFYEEAAASRPLECRSLQGNRLNLSIGSSTRYKNGLFVSFTDAKKDQQLMNLALQTRTILEAISNSVVITDRELKILNCNKAFINILETEESNIIGRNLQEIYNSIKLNLEDEAVSALNNSGTGNHHFETEFTTSSGKKKYLLYQSSPIFNVAKELIGYVIVYSDITSLKEEQKKLLQQEKLAIIGQMGSGIVHETKNHLASIKGYCQLLSLKAQDAQNKRYISRIETITEDVNKVIADFLSLAKPATSVMDVVSLNELVSSMRYMLESPSFIKGVDISIVLCEDERDILAEETQIKQVLLNMSKNAIEAMSGSPVPHLEIYTQLTEDKSKMQLIIADNGKGISPENLRRLGTPFFTTKPTGTGLGLSVCYRIVEEHKGYINVISREGEGTRFVISFPIFPDAEKPSCRKVFQDSGIAG